MNNKDFTDSERILMLEQFREDFKKRIDSYHEDVKKMPEFNERKIKESEEYIILKVENIFNAQIQKLVSGMNSKIEASARLCESEYKPLKESVTRLQNDKKWIVGIATICGGFFIKVVDWIIK